LASRLSLVLLSGWLACSAWPEAGCAVAQAAVLDGEVRDSAGAPVPDAVITVLPTVGQPKSMSASPSTSALIDQRGREFIPHVLAVQRGTKVSFPNSDNIQHHVYSISPGNQFEIKLYKGIPTRPIVFNKPGIAVLGCNIHDWMVAYVYVTEAPYLTKSDGAGHWSLAVPVGEYRVTIWHPDIARGAQASAETYRATEVRSKSLSHVLTLARVSRNGKPPTTLQEQVYSGEP
jgi:plastocyanin